MGPILGNMCVYYIIRHFSNDPQNCILYLLDIFDIINFKSFLINIISFR